MEKLMKVRALVLVLCSSWTLLTSLSHADDARSVTVSAAISLKPALLAIEPAYERATGDTVTFNFGASGALLGQIKAGAPVDLFISAADKQIAELIKEGLADAADRHVVARGRLALIVPTDQTDAATSMQDLATAKVKRLAIGQPKTVPAGDYASQVLVKAGLSAGMADKLVYGANVRQVLDYVVRGEVDAGLVYATDAKDAGDTVKVVELVDPSLHEPIIYPAVVLKDAGHRAAADRFMKHLLSDAGQRALADKGFDAATDATPVSSTQPSPTTVPAR